MKRLITFLAATTATTALVAFATPAAAQERATVTGPRAGVCTSYGHDVARHPLLASVGRPF